MDFKISVVGWFSRPPWTLGTSLFREAAFILFYFIIHSCEVAAKTEACLSMVYGQIHRTEMIKKYTTPGLCQLN